MKQQRIRQKAKARAGDAWDRLFQWGDAVRRATGITAEDIQRAIQEYRREKAKRGS